MDSLLNGVFTDTLSVYDRGLAYGDGVFETIAVREGKPLLFAAHMQRLRLGCTQLAINILPDEDFYREAERICASRTGVLKLIVTRGCGGRGYAIQNAMQANRLFLFSESPIYPKKYSVEGIRINICRIRLSEQKQLAGIKHLNRLENVLASREFNSEIFQEGLMLDNGNRIIEGTRSNIIFVRNGELHTPALDRCGVEGVMRNYILGLAEKNGIKTYIRDIPIDELRQMDEAFICNSIIGVWPVAGIEDRISYNISFSHIAQDWITDCVLDFRANEKS